MSESEYVPSEFLPKQYSDASSESCSELGPKERAMSEILFQYNLKVWSWSFEKKKPWRSGKTCKEWITNFLRNQTSSDIGACLYFHVNNDSTMEIVLRRLSGEAIEDNDRVHISAESPTILQVKLEKKVDTESPKERRKM